MKMVKRIAKVFAVLVLLGVIGLGVFVYMNTSAYDASMDKAYDVPPMAITKSDDPAVIARGEHFSIAIAACSAKDCHGADYSGGRFIDMGPVGTFAGPNITNVLPAYSDGELARLIRHGIKNNGRSICFMPVGDFDWLPDDDVKAIVSYARTMKPSDKPSAGATNVKTLGKILDHNNKIAFDIARRIDHDKIESAPPPSPTPAYGKFIARLCTGCHGEHLSGGKIPGAPAKMAVPLNLTPDATGLAGWTYQDFEKMLETGNRKNGTPLDKMMAVDSFREMDDTERHALFSYLQTLPPTPFGNR
jgi:mono/diheme cytochrome c family protein